MKELEQEKKAHLSYLQASENKNAMQETLNNQIGPLQKEAESNKSEMDELKKQLLLLTDKYKTLQVNNEGLAVQNGFLEDSIGSLQKEAESNKSEMNELKRQLLLLTDKTKTLQVSNEGLVEQNGLLEDTIEVLKTDHERSLSQLQKQLNDTEKRLEEAERLRRKEEEDQLKQVPFFDKMDYLFSTKFLCDCFEHLDNNGDGSISLVEFLRLPVFGKNNAIFYKLDADKSGSIDMDEFVQGMKLIDRGDNDLVTQLEKWKSAIEVARSKKEKEEFVVLAETEFLLLTMEERFKKFEYLFSTKFLFRVFDFLNTNKDGTISLDEFTKNVPRCLSALFFHLSHPLLSLWLTLESHMYFSTPPSLSFSNLSLSQVPISAKSAIIFQRLDEDKSGGLDLNEFIEGLQSIDRTVSLVQQLEAWRIIIEKD